METPNAQKKTRRGGRGRHWYRKAKNTPVAELEGIEGSEECRVEATVTVTLKQYEMKKDEAAELHEATVVEEGEKPRRRQRGGRRRHRKASQKTSESEGSVVEQNTEPSPPWNYRAHRAKNAERRKVYAEEDRIKMEHTIEELKEMWRRKEEMRRREVQQKRLTAEEEMELGFQRMEQQMENLMIQSEQEEYEQMTQFEAKLTQTPLSTGSSGPQAPKSASGDSNSSAYCTEEIKAKLRQIYLNLGLPPPSDLNEVIKERPLQKPYLPPPPPPPGFMPFFSPIMPPIQFPTYFPYPPPFYAN